MQAVEVTGAGVRKDDDTRTGTLIAEYANSTAYTSTPDAFLTQPEVGSLVPKFTGN